MLAHRAPRTIALRLGLPGPWGPGTPHKPPPPHPGSGHARLAPLPPRLHPGPGIWLPTSGEGKQKVLKRSAGNRVTGSRREKEGAKELIALPLATTRPCGSSRYCGARGMRLPKLAEEIYTARRPGRTPSLQAALVPSCLWAAQRDTEAQPSRWLSPSLQTDSLKGKGPLTCGWLPSPAPTASPAPPANGVVLPG